MMMQETRQHILAILREHGQSTVDSLVRALNERRGAITPVTVRHHLARLQEEGYVCSHPAKTRNTPGRPQYVYALTAQGESFFPNNYKGLASALITNLQKSLPKDTFNVILQGVADSMAQSANIPASATIADRLEAVVAYLNAHGYIAHVEATQDGYLLHTSNCPYHNVNHENALCAMDMRLIATMLGVVPRLVASIAQGDTSCSYFIPYP
jgi:predicted ArsR family transcriptional regulator